MAEPKRPRDLNSLAKSIVDEATDENAERVERPEKNEKAVKRGKARAESLTPERRSEIARKAAEKRWAAP
jgi:hypothetical protein